MLKHAATSRETDSAKHEQLRLMGGDERYLLQSARVRYAPPPINGTGLQSARPEIVFPQLAANAKRDADSAECVRILREMEAKLATKQSDTARYFKILSALQQQATGGSMKALLQQVFTVLLRATYRLNTTDEAAPPTDVDASALSELAGQEYFLLFTHAQQTLEAVNLKKQQLESKLEMENALEHELVAMLNQLDRDLHLIRTDHLENHERVEAERLAVTQLEEEHASLFTQEQSLRKECDGLVEQAEKQRAHLQDLQSKSAYLDFISQIPLKKQLEQKKLKEQEDALAAIVRKEEAENANLERELTRLTEQLVRLEDQYARDVALRQQLANELIDAEQIRDLTEIECRRLRECHTPRPCWDAIIEKVPELMTNDHVEWDELAAAQNSSPAVRLRRAEAAAQLDTDDLDDNEDDCSDTDEDSDDDSDLGGQTQQLVKEILKWIERLQKHCGVNLHLSRIWHDVEEARVELNILQHQVDRAVGKFARLPHSGSNQPHAGVSPTKHKLKQEYICALGVHEEIPLFLRHQGKVKRHSLKKGELESLVRRVWVEKRQREKRNPHLHLPLEEVLYETLHRKYGFQPLIAEWGYNILLSLDMYASDPEIELFFLCLTRALSDQVFLDQELMLDKCVALLTKLSVSYNNESFVTERRVLLKDALVALRKFFPLKTTLQLQTLEKAMIRDMHKMKRGGNDSILYIDDVMPRAVSYPRGFFVKAIRAQHAKEIQEYYTLLAAELQARDQHKTGELQLQEVREAMFAVDPLADQHTVWSALMRGMGVKSRVQLDMHEIVPYRAVLRKMNTTGLMKFALNFDPNAELNWQRRGTIDLSILAGRKQRNSLSAQQSFAVMRATTSRPSSPDQSPPRPTEPTKPQN